MQGSGYAICNVRVRRDKSMKIDKSFLYYAKTSYRRGAQKISSRIWYIKKKENDV